MKNYQFVNVWRRRVTFDLFFFFCFKVFSCCLCDNCQMVAFQFQVESEHLFCSLFGATDNYSFIHFIITTVTIAIQCSSHCFSAGLIPKALFNVLFEHLWLFHHFIPHHDMIFERNFIRYELVTAQVVASKEKWKMHLMAIYVDNI